MMKNKSGNLDEKQIKNLEIVHKCGMDLLYLINDVLDLSKLDAKQNHIHNTKIKVKEFMTSIYEMFYSQTKAKNLELIFEIDDSLDFIYSDQEKIKQIVKNLLSNALKFTSQGKIEFLIKDDKNNIKILIKDEGIGIAQDKQEYIFERFKQLDGSITRKYGGTGLGLTICKELVTLLNADIKVISEVNKGSTFEVTIPKNSDLVLNLNFKETQNKNLENSKEKIENIPQFEVKSENIEKEEIYILNNDPISFFNLIIELNKKYHVKQISKIEQLFFLEKDIQNKKVIIDISKLENKEIIDIGFRKSYIIAKIMLFLLIIVIYKILIYIYDRNLFQFK